MENKEMICIVCPIGCHLNVSAGGAEYVIEGNKCDRGRKYAIDELTNPLRTVTSTVRVKGHGGLRLPVKTDKAFPKGRMLELMRVIKNVEIERPIRIGQIIIGNVLGTQVNIVSSKTF